jgi:DNA-3-methyladenine glycosylase I
MLALPRRRTRAALWANDIVVGVARGPDLFVAFERAFARPAASGRDLRATEPSGPCRGGDEMVRGRMPTRCPWAGFDPEMCAYHDEEWGVPAHDDRVLFEFLTLEGAQAGLSWSTILHKREGYRRAFAGFDPRKVARFTPARVEVLMQDPGIVRNRLKIESTLANAREVLAVQNELGSLDAYLWSFVGGATIRTRRRSLRDLPATTPESDAMSRDMKKRGFRFCGSTICYALMQACGLVDDHVRGCFRV